MPASTVTSLNSIRPHWRGGAIGVGDVDTTGAAPVTVGPRLGDAAGLFGSSLQPVSAANENRIRVRIIRWRCIERIAIERKAFSRSFHRRGAERARRNAEG